MSRRSTAIREKVGQAKRKGTDPMKLIPFGRVKGKGVRGGWRVTDHGFTKFAAINTGKVCTEGAKTETQALFTREMK